MGPRGMFPEKQSRLIGAVVPLAAYPGPRSQRAGPLRMRQAAGSALIHPTWDQPGTSSMRHFPLAVGQAALRIWGGLVVAPVAAEQPLQR